MDFSSDESAYKAYRKYGGNHGFDVRRQRTAKKNNKLVRMVYVCSKEGLRQELKVKKSYARPTTRCGCKARMSCYLQVDKIIKLFIYSSEGIIQAQLLSASLFIIFVSFVYSLLVSIFVLTPMLLLHSSVSCGSRLFFFFLLCIFFSATLLCSLFSATLLCSLLGHFFLDPICL
ncbi:BnaA02g18540D [Brassica napus]|uniref:(rape) hypothetical protein n=1 Tax=Brassica napus TaxID=3708 RepID=A0A078HL01_BRANA|nr:unnamed protein product [Brassica napus]CDY38361.1 BnaA02g18540D [Brassica napus]